MPPESKPAHPTFSEWGAEWLAGELDSLDEAVEKLRATGSSEGMKGTTIEAAIVAAQSNRVLGAMTVAAAHRVELTAQGLTKEIRNFTTKADQGTSRLVFWTMVLAVLTCLLTVAAFVQAYTVWSAPAPQIIVTPPTPEPAPGP